MEYDNKIFHKNWFLYRFVCRFWYAVKFEIVLILCYIADV